MPTLQSASFDDLQIGIFSSMKKKPESPEQSAKLYDFGIASQTSSTCAKCKGESAKFWNFRAARGRSPFKSSFLTNFRLIKKPYKNFRAARAHSSLEKSL